MVDFKVAIGQDSHRFEKKNSPSKPLKIGGFEIKNHPGFLANSDGDIVLHAITNAISSITKKKILGKIADKLCQQGKTDSKSYLDLALSDLEKWQINHIAVSIEGLTPKLANYLTLIEKSVAKAVNIKPHQVGITATSGEGLSEIGKGLGMQATAVVTLKK